MGCRKEGTGAPSMTHKTNLRKGIKDLTKERGCHATVKMNVGGSFCSRRRRFVNDRKLRKKVGK